MPRKRLLTREDVIEVAFQEVRTKGLDRLTARELALALGTSTQPIFSLFESMEEIESLVIARGKMFLHEFIGDVTHYDMPFKRLGLRIVAFAREEPVWFDILFTHGYMPNVLRDSDSINHMSALRNELHLSEEETSLLFEQCAIFTFGLAQICAGDPSLGMSDERVSAMLGRTFLANLAFIKANGTSLRNREPQRQEESNTQQTHE